MKAGEAALNSNREKLYIRRALKDDGPALSALAIRSKAYWGYDDAFMRAMAPLLNFTSVDFSRENIYLIEFHTTIQGFYRLRLVDGQPFLDDLWIDPPHIRTGLGRRLWLHAVACARDLGWDYVLIESDPGAERFYINMGAQRIGERTSAIGRALPLLRFQLVRETGC